MNYTLLLIMLGGNVGYLWCLTFHTIVGYFCGAKSDDIRQHFLDKIIAVLFINALVFLTYYAWFFDWKPYLE